VKLVGHIAGTSRSDFEWRWHKVKVSGGQNVNIFCCE